QVRRMVLRLVFAEPISYSPEQGVRTPKTTIPFRYLEGLGGEKMGMARFTGESSNTVEEVFEVLAEWEEELKSQDLSVLEMEP
ncbi:MAG: hypothetical protein AAGI03_13055, partial [Pseudomonadota bacterium]